MNILVTGGAGFIGSHISEKFYNEGHNVIIVDNLSSGSLENIKNIKGCLFYKKDIRDKSFEDVFIKHKIDLVYHEAAQISVSDSIKDPKNDAEINIVGLISVLNMCVKYNVKKIMFASSAAVYGIPSNEVSKEDDDTNALSFYALTKKASEDYIKLYSEIYGLNYVILRYSNVFGDRQNSKGEAGVVALFSDAMVNNKDVYIYGDGNQTRDFIYVKDVAKANYIVGVEEIYNTTFNVSNNSKTSINELFEYMAKSFEYEKKAIYKEERVGDIRDSRLDNTKLLTLTSYNPDYSMEKAMLKYAGSLKNVLKRS